MDTKTLLTAVAVCDALGAPFEEVPRRRRPDHLPERSFLAEDGTRPLVAILGGTALYGTFTDDTQIALAAVDALRRAPSDPLPAYRENLIAWGRGAFTVQGRRLDVGIQTSRAIRALARGRTPRPTDSSGNACLLVASAVYAERGDDRALIEGFVRTTHNSDEAVSSSAEFLRLVAWIEGGKKGREPLTLGGERIDSIDIGAVPPSGYSVHTAIRALGAFASGLPMADAVRRICLAGGDTDSIAAAYAVLATAEGLTPGAELVRTMLGRDVIASVFDPAGG